MVAAVKTAFPSAITAPWLLVCAAASTPLVSFRSRISRTSLSSASAVRCLRLSRQPVDLVDDEDVDAAGPDIGEQALQRRPLHIAAREPAIGICAADSVERADAELACPR